MANGDDFRKQIILQWMAKQAIPDGCISPFMAGVEMLTSGKMGELYRRGEAFVDEAWRVMQTSPDNPFPDQDAFLKHLADELEKRKAVSTTGR